MKINVVYKYLHMNHLLKLSSHLIFFFGFFAGGLPTRLNKSVSDSKSESRIPVGFTTLLDFIS